MINNYETMNDPMEAGNLKLDKNRRDSFSCDKHVWPYGIEHTGGPICPWCELNRGDQLRKENAELKAQVKRLRDALAEWLMVVNTKGL